MALINTKTAEEIYAYLQRLYGRTYGSNDESSVFQRQLRSWAVLLATGRDDIDRAFRNAYPDLANELATEWERAFNLPNDSARTLAQRQARLAAHERTQRGAARGDLQDSLDVTSVLASFVANRRDEVLMAGSEAAAIFQSTLQLANEDFFDPILREAVETIYGNALPAKHVGALDKPGQRASTCVEVGAEWNSTTHHVGRDAIARQVHTARSEFMPPARVRSFGPGSRIDARDLNRIQETMVGCPLTDQANLLDFTAVAAGLNQYWFGADAQDGVATIIDDAIDWRDRFVLVFCSWSRANGGSAVEIVPSGANDDQWGDRGTGLGDVFNGDLAMLYTGAGSTGATVHRAYIDGDAYNPITPQLAVYSDTSGDLTVLASSDDYFVAGCIFVTPQLGK